MKLLKDTMTEDFIQKLGGIDELVEKGIIGDRELWESKEYNVDNVRSLIIKYANKLD